VFILNIKPILIFILSIKQNSFDKEQESNFLESHQSLPSDLSNGFVELKINIKKS